MFVGSPLTFYEGSFEIGTSTIYLVDEHVHFSSHSLINTWILGTKYLNLTYKTYKIEK